MYSSYFVIKEREIVVMRKKSVIHYAIFRTSESILHEILKEGEMPSLNTQSCNRKPSCNKFTFENLRSPKKGFIQKNLRKNEINIFSENAIVF